MISSILIVGVLIGLMVAFTEPVTQLPWGLEEPAVFLINTFNVLANTMPWLATVLNVFIIGMLVKVGLWLFDKFLYMLQLIRG